MSQIRQLGLFPTAWGIEQLQGISGRIQAFESIASFGDRPSVAPRT